MDLACFALSWGPASSPTFTPTHHTKLGLVLLCLLPAGPLDHDWPGAGWMDGSLQPQLLT